MKQSNKKNNTLLVLIMAGFVSTLISCNKASDSGGVVSNNQLSNEEIPFVWDNNNQQQSQQLVAQLNNLLNLGGGAGGNAGGGANPPNANGGIVGACGLPNLAGGNSAFVGCSFDEIQQALINLINNNNINNNGNCGPQFISDLQTFYNGIIALLNQFPMLCVGAVADWQGLVDHINAMLVQCGAPANNVPQVCAAGNPNGGNNNGGGGVTNGPNNGNGNNGNGGNNPMPLPPSQITCEKELSILNMPAIPGSNVLCSDVIEDVEQQFQGQLGNNYQSVGQSICANDIQSLNKLINALSNASANTAQPLDCEKVCVKGSIHLLTTGFFPGPCLP